MTEAPVGLPSSLLSRLPTATPKVATHPSGRHGSTLQGLLVAGQKANRLEATPNRRVATQYGLNEASVRRHRAEHLAAKVVKAQAGRDLLESESLAEQINTLRRRVDILFTDATELLQKSKDGGDSKVALQAINSARACVSESRELTRVLAELAGQLSKDQQRSRSMASSAWDDAQKVEDQQDHQHSAQPAAEASNWSPVAMAVVSSSNSEQQQQYDDQE